MFRHVVMFRFKQDAGADQIDAALTSLLELPQAIDVVRRYEVGRNAGVAEGAFDACIVAEFDDADSYLAYRDHPLHVEHATQTLGPLVAERAAIQFEV